MLLEQRLQSLSNSTRDLDPKSKQNQSILQTRGNNPHISQSIPLIVELDSNDLTNGASPPIKFTNKQPPPSS